MDNVDFMGEFADPGASSNWVAFAVFALIVVTISVLYHKYSA